MAGKPKLTPEQRAANRKASIARWKAKNVDYDKQYYVKNKAKASEQSRDNYRCKKTEQPWLFLLRGAKARAAEKGIDFDLDAEFIQSIWTNVCPVLNIPLVSAVHESAPRGQSKSKPHDNSPTLDRIDPLKGYTKDNVVIMSYRANMIKNCGSAEEHYRIAQWMEQIMQSARNEPGLPNHHQ